MALFQKKPDTSSSAPLYTVGLSKTILVVGLGNPGKKYDLTRHNAGFLAVDNFAQKSDASKWVEKKDLNALEAIATIGATRVIIIKPSTYMNNSGQAVQAVQHFYKITNNETVVVHDELDITFGQIRTRKGGSSAGHNGLKSVMQHCGEDFNRIRIGVGNEYSNNVDSADFVLDQFSKDEQSQLPHMTREVTAILNEFIADGHLPHDTRNFLI